VSADSDDTVEGVVADPLDLVSRSVLGLVVSYQDYDADRPWVKRNPATRNAQAVLIEGRLLLTSAQMVAGATLVEVEREGRPPRAIARVVHQDRELNLALLAVDQPGFLDDLDPLPFADATPTSGTLLTVRWSNQQFEVAAIRVKRPGVAEVWFGRLRHAFLLGRTDLADGGWAEPVVDGQALVGLTSGQDEHTAWVVPVDILRAYVEAARDPASYRGFPVLRFGWQWTMDRALAGFLGLGDQPRGVMVRWIPRGSTGDGVLRPRDVLLELDGHEIDSRGYYLHPRYGWLEFTHVAIDGHRVGDVVPARILRDGVELELSLTLRGYSNTVDLIPLRRGNEPPPYAIAGGLVFLELDGDYLRTWGSEWWNRAPNRLVSLMYLDEGNQRPERRRIVLLSQVLPSAWSIGYQDCRDLVVRRIDGRDIDSIADVVDAFAQAKGPFVRVEFLANEERAELVLDATTLAQATAKILEDYDIPAPYRLPERPLPPLD
jgi:S1-C subfamily serine protease